MHVSPCTRNVFLSPLKKKISESIEVKGVVMPRKLHSWESPRCYRFSITHNVALVSQVGPLLKGSPHTCGVTFSQWRGPLSLATDPHQSHMCFIRPPAVPIGEELNLRCCSHAVSRSKEHFLNINILWVYIHNCSKLFKCTPALLPISFLFLFSQPLVSLKFLL